MKIDLGDGFRLSADERQYIIEKVSINKTGKNAGEERIVPIGYFVSIDKAVTFLAHRQIRTCEAQTIADLQKHAENVISELTQALEPIFEVNVK